ncbi:hypothetical protein [Nocardia sp. AG03]|uniref:hypothetical protein n=1 Tax=Nocardia sp. AG03 TaxID=3025312 RepID=UPI0024187112|nr:hypothetical protein [Nocardia sp. AG03]
MPSTNFDVLVAEAQTRYAPELIALAELGWDAQIRVVGHVNICLPGLEVRGAPVELLVCNGDGLVLGEDSSTDWCAAVYSRIDGSPLDIFCYADTAVAAVQAADALLDDPIRIAARSLTGSWHFAMLPAAALGDANREATLLGPLTSDGFSSTNVIVLEDTPAWTQGCSTHSGCYPIEREAAAFTHRDCAHDRLVHWSRVGLVDDWWASWTGRGPV